jgi:hypothetical protein
LPRSTNFKAMTQMKSKFKQKQSFKFIILVRGGYCNYSLQAPENQAQRLLKIPQKITNTQKPIHILFVIHAMHTSHISLFLSYLVRPLLPTHRRCRGWLLHLVTRILGRSPLTRDQPVADASTCTTQNIHKRQISMPPAGFEPAIPASERPQTYALDR